MVNNHFVQCSAVYLRIHKKSDVQTGQLVGRTLHFLDYELLFYCLGFSYI